MTGRADRLNPRDILRHPGPAIVQALRSRELRRFIQFGLVGLSGVGVNMGTFWLFTRMAHVKDLVALIFAYTAATLSNFILNDIWTFRDKRVAGARATSARAVKFGLVSGVAIGLYYAVYTPLTRLVGVYDLLALASAIGVGLAWNFSANVLWTWRKAGQA
jgi:dolichol-phosphate mannosyltransferase